RPGYQARPRRVREARSRRVREARSRRVREAPRARRPRVAPSRCWQNASYHRPDIDLGDRAMTIQTLTDEQRAFVEAMRDFAQRECGTREQRDALTDGGREPHNQQLYERIADLGWIGVSIPEQYGGSG